MAGTVTAKVRTISGFSAAKTAILADTALATFMGGDVVNDDKGERYFVHGLRRLWRPRGFRKEDHGSGMVEEGNHGNDGDHEDSFWFGFTFLFKNCIIWLES
jgi:hypothetical protein